MKQLKIALALSTIVILGSCSSSRYTASRDNDDVYYSTRDRSSDAYDNSNAGNSTGNNSDTQTSSGDYSNNSNSNSSNERFQDGANNNTPSSTTTEQRDGNTYITNNYYDDDDYYDYAYTARIRRFNHPCGWSYYDPFYTNAYWYDYNPYSYGVSIYLGYNFWQPHYGFGFSYGYPYYDPFYSPWHGYGGYGSGYYHGYNHGYNNGYWDGYYAGLYNGTFNPYYFNSHDAYSYYYGPRNFGTSGNTQHAPHAISQLYASATNDAPHTPKINTINSETAPPIKSPFSTPKNVLNAELANPNNPVNNGDVAAPVKNPKSNVPVKNNTGDYSSPVKNPVKNEVPVKSNSSDYNAPVHNPKSDTPVKNPKQDTPIRNNDPKDYSSPNPKSNQPVKNNDNNTPGNNEYSNPRGNTNEYNAPANNNPRNNEYSNPRGNTNDYNAPANNNPRNNEYSNPRGNEVPRPKYVQPREEKPVIIPKTEPRKHEPNQVAPEVKPRRNDSYSRPDNSNSTPSYNAPRQEQRQENSNSPARRR